MKRNIFKMVAAIAVAMIFSVGCSYPDDNGGDTTGGGDGGGAGGGDTGGGGTNVIPTITIQNNTGYSISGIYIKPSTSTDWGSNLYGYQSLSEGTSRTFTLSQSLSANNVYDILLSQQSNGSGSNFRKYKVTVSNNMTITFSANDLNDGSNLPSITVQNRSGVTFNSLHIKPSTSSDWGESFGSISNNNDRTVTIPIPPSSYTVFDIQLRSSNPANTYTRNNVTVSDGLVLTYTSADSDNPLTTMPIIVIQNNTGYTISGIYIKSSTSTDWGSNLYGYSSLSNGTSRTFTLSEPLSAQSEYDIRLTQNSNGGGSNFIKYNLTVSEGMVVTLTASDLE